MKSWGCSWRLAARTPGTGAVCASSTRISATMVTAVGTTVCMVMQSWQWSASVGFACVCTAWATASIASSARHNSAIATIPRDRGPWRLPSCVSRERNKQNSPVYRILAFARQATSPVPHPAAPPANQPPRAASKIEEP